MADRNRIELFECRFFSTHLYQGEVRDLELECAFSRYEDVKKRIDQIFLEAFSAQDFKLPAPFKHLHVAIYEIETVKKRKFEHVPGISKTLKTIRNYRPPFLTLNDIFTLQDAYDLKTRLERLTFKVNKVCDVVEWGNRDAELGNTGIEKIRKMVLEELENLDDPNTSSMDFTHQEIHGP